MKKTAEQKAMDNRANQLNPNNSAYWNSRKGGKNKKKGGNNSKNHHNQTTKVIHHHHHHNHKSSNNNGQTRACRICGARGCLKTTGFYGLFGRIELRCSSCGGTFFVEA